MSHFLSEEFPVPLAVASILAIFVVLAGDWAAQLGYSFVMASVLAVILLIAGWIKVASGVPSRGIVSSGTSSLLLLTALALAIPFIILPVPLDTDAQGFGYLSLMIRQGGTINSLSPWHPEISFLYSPGALLIFATLSRFFAKVPISAVMMGATHAIAFFFVWLAGVFGYELGSRLPAWSFAAMFSAALSIGLWTALLDSHYTAIFGLFFALAFLTSLFRFLRTGKRVDFATMAILLAAIFMTHSDTTIIVLLSLVSFFFSFWFAVDRPSNKQWLQVSFGVPIAALILSLPWLIRIWPLLESGIQSPFQGWLAGWKVSLLYHGLLWPVLGAIGAAIYIRFRQLWAIMMVLWLILSFEFSTFGFLSGTQLFRFNYPFSIAWHAPIIPYIALGSGALVSIAQRVQVRSVFRAATASVAILLLCGMTSSHLLSFSKRHLAIYGAFATANDIQAMCWLRDHTEVNVRILNYPGDYEHLRDWEAHWAPVITERDCVYFRRQPFYNISNYPEQESFLAFWRNPADIANAELLKQSRISYVLLPESVGDPSSLERSWRWQPPAMLEHVQSMPKDASYLKLAYQSGGAQVYEVR
ncbi:MAG: hypothetical protein C5B54_00860 [Acidobacteria bacterium]|nr:MAG: hypothetical protein C5B54_00860 [Acidobacteriota bacterium]